MDTTRYEDAACGLLETDLDGVIPSINRTMLNWIGRTADELVGRSTLAELLTGGGRIYYETHYAPLLAMQGSAREIAFDMLGHDGHRLPVLVNAKVDRTGPGAPRIRVAVFDATERRMYEGELLKAKQRAEESEAHARLLARTLQSTLIPHQLPLIPGLDLAAAYRPAGAGDQIGGDFYDAFRIGVDEWMVAIGDVEGKGVDAAVVTALTRYTIRAAAVEHGRPSEVLKVVNEVLLRDEAQRFCTAALLRCRRVDHRWTVAVACAGHPLPILVSGSRVQSVGRPGTLLGFLDTVSIHDVEFELDPSSLLVVYTDGVSEARRHGKFFGEDRIREIAVGSSDKAPGDVVDAIVQSVIDYAGPFTTDDVTLLGLRASAETVTLHT